MIQTLAEQYKTAGQINETAAGRKIGLSHTSIRDRKLARALRVMQALHRDCPEIWNGKLRPMADQLTAPEQKLAAA
jgi:hypothetical protein